MARPEEIEKIWVALCASYPTFGKETDPERLSQTLNIYERLLADLPIEALEAAVMQHIAESRFFPTVAELRTKTMILIGPRRPSAMEAWGDVRKAFSRYGRYRQPEFENPIVAKVVESMGWVSLCDGENEAADRSRFIQAYEIFCRREQEDVLLLPEVRRFLTGYNKIAIEDKDRRRNV